MENEQDSSRTDHQEIAIPLSDPRILGKFIANLLGQRRSIERKFDDRRFVIDHTWLLNLDQIIKQRLAAQNAAKLISFMARIYFANGKVLTLNDEKAFNSYSDMSNELSVGVDLHWDFLIKFPLAKMPEKQEIRFSAFADKDIKEKKQSQYGYKSFVTSGGDREQLSYEIQFTDVTWGEDISNHIANYILAKTEPFNKWSCQIKKIPRELLLPLSMLLGMLIMIWSTITPEIKAIDDLHTKYGNALQLVSRMEQKIDFLYDSEVARVQNHVVTVAPFLNPIFAPIVFSALFFALSIRKRSFININDYSKQYLKRYGNNYEYIKYGIIITSIISIMAGIFANKIYDLIKGSF